MRLNAPRRPVPFHFGREDTKLFGCFHEPSDKGLRRCAVLVCQPVGHEYVNSHRALRQLAVGLADIGFPVLRFDYYGCGDSSGEPEQGSLSRWVEDTSIAARELRIQSGLSRVCVVGLRLGATLAAFAGSRGQDFESLVLWDPVVNGKTYLKELIDLHEDMLRFRPRPRRSKRRYGCVEILGFSLSSFLHSQLEELDLTRVADKPAAQVLIMRTEQFDRDRDLKPRLFQDQSTVEHRMLKAPRIWLPTTDGSLLVPSQVLQSIVAWVSNVSA